MLRKKFIALICIVGLSFSLTACGAAEKTAADASGGSSKSTNSGSFLQNLAGGSKTDSAPAEVDGGYFYTEAETNDAPSYYVSESMESVAADMAVGSSSADLAYTNEAEYYEPDFNTEEYNYIKENSFLKVATSPLSTFAADVDTGSYTNFRRMINDNYSLSQIPSGAIRAEEMINYFNYEVKETRDNKRFAVSYETGVCPWNEDNDLLMMTVKAKDVDLEYVGNNFVFLIDSSGSMSSNDKGALAIRSFKLLAETLTEDDRVSIVTYSGSSRVVLDSCDGDNYRKICKALDSIQFGGGTNGSGGITAAYELADENFMEGGNNRVIIASDGDMNLGITSTGGLTELISEKKESGVFLTVLGYGTGNYSDANMESLADCGNGNYHYIDCIEEAERVLVDQLKQTTVTVAKDVKLQVEFNPTKVSEYRLIGYENRTMAAEDFEDDTKDGGETGAGQTVTVVYELVRNKDGNTGSDLKYQTDRELTDAALSNELLTLSIRYKEPDGRRSVEENFDIIAPAKISYNLSEDLSFVAGVVELTMIINNSQYMGDATLDSAYRLVKNGTADDEAREELAKMMRSLR
ncbi:MAG: von Willebrand factor type A domain-containing protein [Lachnospiraceae bacterium]|nr:von Willebrand factor type A domain-containing protein [Lachnospiraceae bacterium]